MIVAAVQIKMLPRPAAGPVTVDHPTGRVQTDEP